MLNNLKTAPAATEALLARAERAAAIAASHADTCGCQGALSRRSDRRAESRKTAGHHGARQPGRRGGQRRRCGGCVFPPGPRLFLDRHDLRDASGEGRLCRASRHGQRLAPRFHGPDDRRPACCWPPPPPKAAAAAMCVPPKRRWNNPTAASCCCATPA